jgi:hypothetical protein
MKKLSYIPTRTAVSITGIVFFSQLLLEMSGAYQRKPEYWWIVPATGVAFGLAVLYSIAVVVWNARIDYQQQVKP